MKNAVVYINGEKTGSTNKNGLFNHELKFTNQILNIICTKDGYVEEEFALNLEPGINKKDITLKTISCQIKCYD